VSGLNIDKDTGVPEGYRVVDDPTAAAPAPFSWEKYQQARGRKKANAESIKRP
jgi:hypothetical protein